MCKDFVDTNIRGWAIATLLRFTGITKTIASDVAYKVGAMIIVVVCVTARAKFGDMFSEQTLQATIQIH